MTPADYKLNAVYGDTIHRNGGLHLTGGLANDSFWQKHYQLLISSPHRMYYLPNHSIGTRFVSMLALEWKGVRQRKWNSERPLLFPMMILCKHPSVTKTKDIKACLSHRLDLWESEKFDALATECNQLAQHHNHSTYNNDDDSTARRFNNLVLTGRMRVAVRTVTSRYGGGLLFPTDRCTKNPELSVAEVLTLKHPELRIPDITHPECLCFESYTDVPDPTPIMATIDAVEDVAPHLHGSAGPSGVDSTAFTSWLLRYGDASTALREEMAAWLHWLANCCPPWSAYRALMAKRLVALDKQPGVRPIGIGEIMQRLLAKIVIKDCMTQAKQTCNKTQLCAGLEAGIEGAIHAVRYRAQTNDKAFYTLTSNNDTADSEDIAESVCTHDSNPTLLTQLSSIQEHAAEGLTLIDARNGFNELSRMAMLWTVRHRWPKGSRFAFNCYRHESMLILRQPGDKSVTLWSKEGVTQGDPLGMILYGIALTPLAEHLGQAFPDVLQPWYADDSALMGRHTDNAACLKALSIAGPWFGYYPEPKKSWYICTTNEEETAKQAFASHGLNINFTRGHRYMGGFIGDADSLQSWLNPLILKWEQSIITLASIAKTYPQTAYAAMVHSLQAEWQYMSRVIPSLDQYLHPLENAIQTHFLPALFGGHSHYPTNPAFRTLLAQKVKNAGLGINNPVSLASHHYNASQQATQLLVESMVQSKPFKLDPHRIQVKSSATTFQSNRHHREMTFIKNYSNDDLMKRHIHLASKSGMWLTALPRIINGTHMSSLEFRDALRIRYGLPPLNLATHCDGCNAPFTISHAMSCKIGGLVSRRHDAGKYEWMSLCKLAFSPSKIIDEPYIFSHGPIQHQNNTHDNSQSVGPEARGDFAIKGFWTETNLCIFDIRITDVNASSYHNTSPEKILLKAETSKKNKYLHQCMTQRKHFTPLVYSIEGFPGPETKAAERRLGQLLSEKLSRPYSEMVGWLRQRMSISIIRHVSLLLRGMRTHTTRLQIHNCIADSAAMLDMTMIRDW